MLCLKVFKRYEFVPALRYNNRWVGTSNPNVDRLKEKYEARILKGKETLRLLLSMYRLLHKGASEKSQRCNSMSHGTIANRNVGFP